MPYYVYKVFPDRRAEYLADFAAYKQARALARETRATLDAGDECAVKMVFAKDRTEAKSLILTPRPRPVLMEHEK